jgi:hypothetical protein
LIWGYYQSLYPEFVYCPWTSDFRAIRPRSIGNINMAYLIVTAEENSTIEEKHYQIQIEDFALRLRERWADVEIQGQLFPGDTYLLNWSIAIGNFRLVGGIQGDRRTITLEDFPEGAIQFAVWYRSITPLTYRLFISHDSSGNEYEVLSITTESELSQELDRD